LGALLNYSVLGGAAVTNTGATTTDGAVGVSPGSSITGFPPGIAGGDNATHLFIPPAANAAQADALTLWGTLDQTCDGSSFPDLTDLSTTKIGINPVGNFPPGVYCSVGSFKLTGTINLIGSGVWIFKTVSTLITSPGSSVTGGDPCNVWWRIGSSTTLDTTTSIIGTVISHEGINAMNTGATLNGRFLALSAGTITLNDNTITGPTCATTTVTGLSAGSVTTGTAVHDSATLAGVNSSTATGSITYYVYSDSACILSAGTPVSRTIITPGVLPDSPDFSFSSDGTYYFQAVYLGDSSSLNRTSNSVCGAEVLTVTSPPHPVLPGTGFAPQRATLLSAQPAAQRYADLGDLWLEIPRLGVQMPIVGVPQANGEWEVSWLGNDAGWLNGTAFPTYSGNSVLAGHVYNADGTPGPFVHLNGLWWGDQVIVHARGAQYIYEVRSVLQVSPNATSSVITHKDLPWVTLITCRGYDEASNSYKYRIAVGAVLVEVK
jgi:LPXTG-site transpeptidase (sortase) family protein